ncbi:MAG: RNA polymerase sigma factor [Bacteroidales bacterium]|jgi:RNA polymerase sigma-70 factor (ECF subfamily)|nr:RNA polymerase sigma factor [Bacteroidales bacterium]MBR2227353.1 RNA polymerase sigma factor [Bacteroidales bacterium]MBR2748182.1 RNA polymerase sigma factor [Bacteroidales bacterium]
MKHFLHNLHLLTWTTTEDPPAGGALEQLVPACRSGDRKAQKRLFDALAPKMMVLCLRYVGDRPTAEDVLQDGFVSLFSRLDSYSGAGSFEGWARRIFVNTALMHLRKTDALKLSDDIGEARSLSTEEATPVQKIGYRELMALIARLPADARTIFNMYVIEGYSHKEIAQTLGLNEATSRSKLQRARLRLQEMIKEQETK